MADAPLLLLDVDGVLNALGADPDAWRSYRTGSAVADGRSWPIRWAPDAVARLRSWHEQGRVELQWLTTWGHDANRSLRHLLELPELAVAGTYDEGDAGAREVASTSAHAAHAPSAPDPLTGRWWKYDVVRRVQREHPERLVLWVDDELHRPSAFLGWAREQQRLVPCGPGPSVGLTPADLDGLEAQLPG